MVVLTEEDFDIETSFNKQLCFYILCSVYFLWWFSLHKMVVIYINAS